MKKFTIVIALLLIAGIGFAQIPANKVGVKPANEVKKEISKTSDKATHTFFIDYYQAESNFYGGPVSQGGYFDRYIWDINMNYSTALGDTNHLYCITAFDSLYDPYDDITYDKNSILSMTVDSIWFEFGHENNSGVNDTLRVKIIGLDASGYPQENNVLWSTDIIDMYLSDTNQYNFARIQAIAPNFDIGSAREFGVVIEYFGHRTDSAGFIAGYGDMGPCNTASTSAYRSLFYPNSFALWQEYESYGILPTASGGHIYYDCNQNGSFDPGVDGDDFIQNIDTWVKVTIEDNVGINENDLGVAVLGQNYPNPFSGTTTIDYQLTNSNDISLEVYDITGRQVLNVDEGFQTTGKHTITLNASSLNAGVYYYTLVAGNAKVTKRMIIE